MPLQKVSHLCTRASPDELFCGRSRREGKRTDYLSEDRSDCFIDLHPWSIVSVIYMSQHSSVRENRKNKRRKNEQVFSVCTTNAI